MLCIFSTWHWNISDKSFVSVEEVVSWQ